MLKLTTFLFTLGFVVLIGAGCSSKQPASNNWAPANQPQTNAQLENTNQPENTNIEKTYTMAEVKMSNTPDKCWTVIRNKVYDVTAFINKHPGGDKNILKLCGIDGTALFVNKHGGMPQPEQTLQGFEIGKLE
jgi:cytochrome b involved in lipid metabolism